MHYPVRTHFPWWTRTSNEEGIYVIHDPADAWNLFKRMFDEYAQYELIISTRDCQPWLTVSRNEKGNTINDKLKTRKIHLAQLKLTIHTIALLP